MGGKAPIDEGSVTNFASDEICTKFLASEEAQRLTVTKHPSEVNPADYAAILYVGGHGPMWDTPDNADIQKICASIYEAGGVVSAVCHGPCGIVNVKLSNGKYLIDGKEVTGFTNAEEEAVGLTSVMPFLLETKMKERGARFHGAANWAANVVVCERVVTGQNPASATPLGQAVAQLLQQ